MAVTPYNAENVISLLAPIHPPEELNQNNVLVATAWEILKYLRASTKRARPSTHKIAMTIAVSEIWALLRESSSWNPETCAIAIISAATNQSVSDGDDSTAIIAEARSRFTKSLEGRSGWRKLWNQAGLIGKAAGFRLEVEAAQAQLLWERLLVFAADANNISLAESPPTKNDLSLIRDRISATTTKQLTEIHSVYTAMSPVASESLSKIALRTAAPPEQPDPVAPDMESAPWSQLPPSQEDSDAHRIRVWFGTNREPRSPSDPNSIFSNRLSDSLRYGLCTVNVSKVPDATGGVQKFILSLLRIGNPKRASKVDRYYTFKNKTEFLAGLNSETSANPDARKGLLYVHGFNTNFEQAAIAAAEFSIAIKHSGPTAMFSWASAGNLFKYKQDSDTVDKSRHHLVEFLEAFTNQAGLDSVDIVAHSMGNQLVLRALKDWVKNSSPANPPIRNIYLGAPDIAQDEFTKKSPYLKKMVQKATLYISDSDSALVLSRLKNKNPRAGLMPPLTLVPAVDTIETSNIDTSRLRHAYITEAVALRSDVFCVQEGKLDPNLRPNLDTVKTSPAPSLPAPQEYWRFKN